MDWIEVLKQWVLLFAILTVLFVPAFKFRNLAREHNKKGWVYFFVGLAVGIVGFNLGQLVLLPLRYYGVAQEHGQYLILVLLLSAYLFYKFSFKLLKNFFARINE